MNLSKDDLDRLCSALPATVRSLQIFGLRAPYPEGYFAGLMQLQCSELEELDLRGIYHSVADFRPRISEAVQVIDEALEKLRSLRILSLFNVPISENFLVSLADPHRAPFTDITVLHTFGDRTQLALSSHDNQWVALRPRGNSASIPIGSLYDHFDDAVGKPAAQKNEDGILLANPAAVDGLCAPAARNIRTFLFDDIWLSRPFEGHLRARWRELPEGVRSFFAPRVDRASLVRHTQRMSVLFDIEKSPDFLPSGD